MDIDSIIKSRKEEDSREEQELFLERVEEVHEESTIVDGHLCTLYDVVRKFRPFNESSPEGHADLPRLMEGGVDVAIMAAFAWDRTWPVRGVRQGLEYVDAFNSLCMLPGVRAVTAARDIIQRQDSGDLGLMLAFDGGEFMEGSVEVLRMFYKLGLRMLALAWNDRNLLADGAGESVTRGGLTNAGRKIVAECARLGILVDAAHMSEAGFWDLVELGESPFVVSHANCHSLFHHPRNLTDDQLQAIGEAGGLVGISLNPAYFAGSSEEATISRVVDHIMHAMEVAGEENVGIGTDFDSFGQPGPQPVSDVRRLPLLTQELLRRGMSGKTAGGILGGNWLRVIRAVMG